MKSKTSLKSTVLLTAFDSDRRLIEASELPYDDYYENGCPLIDSDDYRKKRGVRLVHGEVYASTGFQQRFDNKYGPSGKLKETAAIFSDGTITATKA